MFAAATSPETGEDAEPDLLALRRPQLLFIKAFPVGWKNNNGALVSSNE